MKNNTLTLSQAHKLYTGNSIGQYVLKLNLGGILAYTSSIIFFLIIMMLSKGNISGAFKELNGTAVVNTFLTIDAGVILMITELINYGKQYPGGKYFRTVKGGFDTYKKMKNAALAARVVSLISIMIFGAIMDLSSIIKLTHGTSDILYIGAFLLISIGLVNFMGSIKNLALRGFLTPFVIFVAGLFGVILPDIFDSNTGIALAFTVAAIPLIIISQKVMLNDYQKNKWNN